MDHSLPAPTPPVLVLRLPAPSPSAPVSLPDSTSSAIVVHPDADNSHVSHVPMVASDSDDSDDETTILKHGE